MLIPLPRSARTISTVFLTLLAMPLLAQPSTPPASDWKPVESALGRSGKAQPDGAFKFSLPRSDMQVTVSGTQVKAGLALGSWVAFNHPGNDAMVMGDLVLAESEVEPVMLKLVQSSIEITALHNHVLEESPRVMYMHIQGHGEAPSSRKPSTTRSRLPRPRLPLLLQPLRRSSISTPRSSIRSSAARARTITACTSSVCHAPNPSPILA